MGAILSKRRGRTTSTTTTTTTTTRPVRAEEKKGRGGNILKILLGICLLFLLGLSTILLIAAFATPWYKVDWEFESPIQGDDENCRVRYLIGWSTVHCKQEGCEDQFAGVQFCPGGDDNNFKWRSLFPATRNVYDVTVGLLAATLAAVLLMLILTMLFLCSKRARNTPYRLAFFGLGILAFFTLLFALIFFGVRINEAFAEDNWYFCNLLTSNIAGGNLQTLPRNVDTPCNSFIGDRSQPYLPSGEKFELTWGGVGYWLAFCAGVFFPLAACLALLPFGRKRERRPEERVVEERRGEYREEVDTGRTYRREETITEAVPRV